MRLLWLPWLLRFLTLFRANTLANDGKNALECLHRSQFREITSNAREGGMNTSDSSGCSKSERSRIEKEGLQALGSEAGKGTRIYR